jgi:hypothetical protein
VGLPRLAIGLTGWSPRAALMRVADRYGAQAVGALVLLAVAAVIVAAVFIDIRVCRRVRLRGGS